MSSTSLSTKKTSRPKLAVVNVRSANVEFTRQLAGALRSGGLAVELPAAPPPQGMLVVEVLDEPGPELGGLFRQSVILAAAGDESLAVQAVRAGAAALIGKPVSLATLVAKIQLIVNQQLEIDGLRRQVEKLGALLTEEQTVSLAVGMLAERFHLTPNEAHERLRRHARSTQSKLQSLGAQIVSQASHANELLRAAVGVHPVPGAANGLAVE